MRQQAAKEKKKDGMTKTRIRKPRAHRQKTVYLTNEEYQQIRDKISGSGVSFSAFCRGLLSSQKLVDKRSIPVEQFRQLSALGNNLNQLTRMANQGQQIPRELLGLLSSLKAHLTAIQEGLQ